MKFPRFISGFLLVSSLFSLPKAQAEDWREALSPTVGVPWLPIPPGRAVYHFGWSGFKAAEADLTFSQKKGVAKLEVEGRTVGPTRMVFRLDSKAILLSDIARFQPIRARVLELYGDRSVVTGLEFGEKSVTYSKARRERSEIPKDLLVKEELDRGEMRELTGRKGKRYKFAGMLDLQSALFYLRAQPLKPGDSYRFVVFHGNAPYYVQAKAGTPAKLKIEAGEYEAIPVEIKLEWVDKKQRLRKHKNFRSATGWFADDPGRMLLKVESDIFVGKVWAELISFTPEIPEGEKPSTP